MRQTDLRRCRRVPGLRHHRRHCQFDGGGVVVPCIDVLSDVHTPRRRGCRQAPVHDFDFDFGTCVGASGRSGDECRVQSDKHDRILRNLTSTLDPSRQICCQTDANS